MICKNSILKLFFVFFTVLSSNFLHAQDFKVSGYVDFYYAHDNDKNGMLLRQFSTIAPIRDEFRINLAQVTGKYLSDKIRGIVTLQFGDIPKYNWPQQSNEYLQYIQEANVGLKPAKNLWIDFGYFLTHIGAEGIIPKNDYLSIMSVSCFYEPIYQSGLKVSYDFSDKFYGSLYLLNGYNVSADNNKNKSVGIQLGYKPNPKIEIIFNNITGNEQPTGSPGKTRIYNNLVAKYAPANKFDILLGASFAIQEKSKLTEPTESANLFSGILTLRYKITPKFFVSVRGEIYDDKDGILSGTFTDGLGATVTGLKATGFTFGVEFKPVDNAYIRTEARYLKASDDRKIFTDGTTKKDSRTEVIMTTGIEF